MLIRRLLLTLTVAVAGATLARPAEAQLKYGVEGAVQTGWEDASTFGSGASDLNGTFGLGVRAALQPPLLPIGVVGQGIYYFPSDGKYMTYSLAAQLRLPLPVFNPYVIGGWQWRHTSDGVSDTQNGPTVGIGVQLNLAISVFLEGTMEFSNSKPSGFSDIDVTPLVIKGGVLLGG